MTIRRLYLIAASAIAFAVFGSAAPASAAQIGNTVWLGASADGAISITEVRHGPPHVRPPRPGYRPGPRPGYRPGWARPGRYYWPRGGAIAAGAALGFVGAATAAAWAGAAPGPGMCWYYTDRSRRQGFWDYCP